MRAVHRPVTYAVVSLARAAALGGLLLLATFVLALTLFSVAGATDPASGGGRWDVDGGRWESAGGRWDADGGRWETAGGRWQEIRG